MALPEHGIPPYSGGSTRLARIRPAFWKRVGSVIAEVRGSRTPDLAHDPASDPGAFTCDRSADRPRRAAYRAAGQTKPRCAEWRSRVAKHGESSRIPGVRHRRDSTAPNH